MILPMCSTPVHTVNNLDIVTCIIRNYWINIIKLKLVNLIDIAENICFNYVGICAVGIQNFSVPS